jgi:carbon monoxide dehydrogenase subunit G
MELADAVVIAAPRQRVWSFLADAAQLSSCLSGMDTVEIAADGSGFAGAATLPLGSQVLRFPTRVEWLEQEPPSHGRLRALATIGGHQVTGEGTIELLEDVSGTEIQWHITLVLPAALQENAMLGPLAKNVAATIVRAFFSCLVGHLQDVSAV